MIDGREQMIVNAFSSSYYFYQLLSYNYQLISMHTIHLHKLMFFAFHGLHEEEKIIGNDFELNVDVAFNTEEPVADLKQTINYVTVYEIIKKRMAIATPLLETIAEDMAALIYQLDARVQFISINIIKINVPINNFSGTVGITYKKKY
ncbi:MAG: dihydroneopterin aldolase [Chitinophagaceae bacterium]|nr:dihydroneopterin aldolase [Chitinophagaceae bacterium]